MSRPCPECKGAGGYWIPEHPRGGGAPAQIKEDCANCKGTGTAPMSRREEVGVWLRELLSGPIRQAAENDILRSKVCDLSDEVDARDAIIDKLLAMLEPEEEPSDFADKYDNDPAYVLNTSTFGVDCALHGQKRDLHARACEIARRVKT